MNNEMVVDFGAIIKDNLSDEEQKHIELLKGDMEKKGIKFERLIKSLSLSNIPPNLKKMIDEVEKKIEEYAKEKGEEYYSKYIYETTVVTKTKRYLDALDDNSKKTLNKISEFIWDSRYNNKIPKNIN